MKRFCLRGLGLSGALLVTIGGVTGTSHAEAPTPGQEILDPTHWMLNYERAVWPGLQTAQPVVTPAGCEQPPVINQSLDQLKACTNSNWGRAVTDECAKFYRPYCDQAQNFVAKLVPLESDPSKTKSVYPIVLDASGTPVYSSSLDTAIYLGYGESDPDRPGLGVTAFSSSTLGNTFATQGLFQVANSSTVLIDIDKRSRLLGSPFAPAWLDRTGIYSCSEYVYKRFFGYQRYVDAALAAGENWDQAFLLAYTPRDTNPMHHGSTNVGISDWDNLESFYSPIYLVQSLAGDTKIPVESDQVLSHSLARNAFFNAPQAVWDILRARASGTNPKLSSRAQALIADSQTPDQQHALNYDLWGEREKAWYTDEFSAHRALYDEVKYRYPNLQPAVLEDDERRVDSFAELIRLDTQLHQQLACLDNPTSAQCTGQGAQDKVRQLAGRMLAEQNPVFDPSDPSLDLVDWDRFQILDPFQAAARIRQLAKRIWVLSSPVLRSVPLQTPQLQQVAEALAVKMQSVGATDSVVQKGSTFSPSVLTQFMVDANIKPIKLTSAQLSALTPSALLDGSAEQLAAVLQLDAGTAALLSNDVLESLPLSVVANWASQNPSINQRLDLSETYRKRAALVAQISEVENKMADALIAEFERPDHGCWKAAPMTITTCNPKDPSNCTSRTRDFNPNRCDWTSKRAVKRFTTMARRFEESEYNRCVKYTGNDFSQTGVLHDAKLQRRKIYPSYLRGDSYYDYNPVLVQVVTDYDPTAFTYTYEYQQPRDKPWTFDALRLNKFMEWIEDSDNRRAGEEVPLIRKINATAQAGKAEMRDMPKVQSAVVDSAGEQVPKEEADSTYGTPQNIGVGNNKSDGDSYGDPKWFSAAWSYDWSWNVIPRLRPQKLTSDQNGNTYIDPVEALNPWQRFAGIEGSYHGKVGAEVRGFFDQFHKTIFEAEVSGTADHHGHVPTQHLTVLGETVDMSTTDNSSGSDFHLVTHGSPPPQEHGIGSQLVPIWGIVLTFDASISMEVGMTHQLDATSPTLIYPAEGESRLPNANFDMSAYFEPYARVSAYGSAGVSVGVASAGGEIHLTLVRVGLPSGVSVKSVPVDPADANFLHSGGYQVVYSEGAKATVEALNGRVGAYMKVGVSPFAKKFSATLFSWDGLTQEVPIIAQRDKTINLSSWAWQIYGSPVSDPRSGGAQVILSRFMRDMDTDM